MLNLETPEYIANLRNGINNLAKGVLRPIARKYDEEEHTYPKELDMFRGMQILGKPKKKKKEGDDKPAADTGNGTIGASFR